MFNFTMALRPQIIKNYAANDREKMLALMFLCSKTSYYLMYIFSLPLILEMQFIFSVWLQNPPEYTVIFSRLVLIEILIGSLSIGLTDVVRSSEKIKLREIIISIIYLFNLPLLYVIFIISPMPPYAAAYSMVFLTFIALVAEIFIARHLIGFSIKLLASTVIAPICIVTVLPAIVPAFLFLVLPQGIVRLCLLTGLSVISTGICIYFFGLNRAEQGRIKSILKETPIYSALSKGVH
jgi:O-antigen/teichoic acid export membrane protein